MGKLGDCLFIIGVILFILIIIYMSLGMTGLLPQWFYNRCEGIDVKTAQQRGCCEDRSSYEPTSLLFGSDNCDRYRNNTKVKDATRD